MGWNDFIERNYEELVRIASGLHPYPNDLVHHCYLRVHDKEVDNKRSYFLLCMWRERYSVAFNGHEHESLETDIAQVENYTDFAGKIAQERIDFMLFNFNAFDREVYELWRGGYNMSQVSRESGVPARTLAMSIERIKNFIKSEL